MRHASLFNGIGGPEVAAEMLGWENVFHCEINPFGRQVLEYWFPNSDSYEDITKTDFTQYRGQIDVLTGGFPCQPFSYAGKRVGREDERYLWPEMLRVINEVRPTWVVGENVAGITTMVESCEITDMGCETSLFQEGSDVQEYRAEFTFTIERICKDLEDLGYSVQPMLIPAAAVGAPHRRDRVFIIAYASDSNCGNDLREPGKYESTRCEEWLSEWNEVRKSGEPSDVRSEIKEHALNSFRLRWDTGEFYTASAVEPRQEKCRKEQSGGADCTYNERLDRGWWRGFPTVSPIHRGNDGLPFDVDNLTISFSKWRSESLKAYGNAIVPQVMYRIFQAIEESYKPQ